MRILLIGAVFLPRVPRGARPLWGGASRLRLTGQVDAVALLGQVELVRQGVERVAGSFTLITGVLAREPIRTGAVAALVNGALESFVLATANPCRWPPPLART